MRVIVVGAGLIGVCSAYFAAKSGHEVVVYDRGDVGTSTTAASGSSVLQQTKRSPILLELTQESMSLYTELAADLDVPYRMHGSHVLFETNEEEAFVQERAAWLRQHNVQVELLGRREITMAIPEVGSGVIGSCYAPSDAEVVPFAACIAVAQGAVRLGVQIVTRMPVSGLDITAGKVRGVLTPAGLHQCDQVIIATGPWMPNLLRPLGIEIPITPQKGELLHSEPISPRLRGRILSVRYLMSKFQAISSDGFSAGMVVGQEPDGSIKMGSTRESAGFNVETTSRARQAILGEVKRYLPSLASLTIDHQTAGLRPYSVLKRPVVCRMQEPEGLVLAGGHGGDGVALAPVTGWMVARLLDGKATRWDGPLGFAHAAETPS